MSHYPIFLIASFLSSLLASISLLLFWQFPRIFPFLLLTVSLPSKTFLYSFSILFSQNELREVREELKEKMKEIKQVTG